MRQRKRPVPGVKPNPAIEEAYRRKLLRLIDEMEKSILYHLGAAYKRNEPEVMSLAEDELAEDALPADALRAALRKFTRRWTKRFNDMAEDLAAYFAKSVRDRSDTALKLILKKGGITVDFRMTRAIQDVMKAQIAENVALIRSIPAQHFTQIEGMVMRSVQAGRDLESLTKDLRHQFGVTKRRAELIARDQNNKATTIVQKVRYQELGIREAVWMHSHAGKEPRPTHVANDGKRFNVDTGWFDPHERKHIMPGVLINCRCTMRPILPGFD